MSNMEKYQKNEIMYKSNESILDWGMGAVKWLAYWAMVVYYALQSPALPKKVTSSPRRPRPAAMLAVEPPGN